MEPTPLGSGVAWAAGAWPAFAPPSDPLLGKRDNPFGAALSWPRAQRSEVVSTLARSFVHPTDICRARVSCLEESSEGRSGCLRCSEHHAPFRKTSLCLFLCGTLSTVPGTSQACNAKFDRIAWGLCQCRKQGRKIHSTQAAAEDPRCAGSLHSDLRKETISLIGVMFVAIGVTYLP